MLMKKICQVEFNGNISTVITFVAFCWFAKQSIHHPVVDDAWIRLVEIITWGDYSPRELISQRSRSIKKKNMMSYDK